MAKNLIKLLHWLHAALCIMLLQAAALMAFAAPVLAATPPPAGTCPPGQQAVSSGSCCPSGNIEITSTGQANCTTSSTLCSKNAAVNCLISKYITPAIELLSAAVGVVAVITIIRGGLEYTSAGGDPAKIAAGKQHIVNALIGLFAYMALFAFLQFIIPGGVV